VSPLLTLTRTQEWERCYLLTKARLLRDAADALAHNQAATATTVSSSQVAAYVASRVEGGAALPEVGVEGVQAEGGGQEGGGRGGRTGCEGGGGEARGGGAEGRAGEGAGGVVRVCRGEGLDADLCRRCAMAACVVVGGM
jgi:uncharacterized membrane protein YgcG